MTVAPSKTKMIVVMLLLMLLTTLTTPLNALLKISAAIKGIKISSISVFEILR